MGYKVIRFIKFLKGYRKHRACISNVKSVKNRRVPCTCIIKKVEENKKEFLFQN